MATKSLTLSSALALSVALSSSVYAADPYVGGNVLFLDYSEQLLDDDLALTAISGRLGSMINDNVSGEVRVGLGVGDDSVEDGGNRYDVELNSMIGAYLKAGFPVADSLFPYAVIGFTRTDIEYSLSGVGSSSESDSDISYGFGVDLSLDRKLSLNVEYMNYYDNDGAEIDGFSIGLAMKL
jgi:opacity protein-like surface antigen